MSLMGWQMQKITGIQHNLTRLVVCKLAVQLQGATSLQHEHEFLLILVVPLRLAASIAGRGHDPLQRHTRLLAQRVETLPTVGDRQIGENVARLQTHS